MAEDNRNAAKNAAKAAAELKKQKKKRWCPIYAPEAFNNKLIGESFLEDASQLMNRTVTVNMMQLMGDMKRQNVSVMFKVVDVKEGKGLTLPMKFEIAPSSMRRFAKREKDKLSDSFVVKTSDGKLVRIKPVMVTNSMTQGAVQAALIKTCRAICKERVNATPFGVLIIDLITNKFQKEVKERLHKTYPLRIFEVRMLVLETKKKKETVEEEMLAKLKKQQDAAAEEAAEEEQESSQSPSLESDGQSGDASDDDSEEDGSEDA